MSSGEDAAQLTVHVGERLRACRESRGLTQGQAAAAAGITRNALSALERRQFPDPSLRTLLGLQRAYGLATIEELLGGGPMPSRVLADLMLGAGRHRSSQQLGA